MPQITFVTHCFFLHEFHLWIYFHLFVHSIVGSTACFEVLITGNISGPCNRVDHCLFAILFSPTLYGNTLLCLFLVIQLCPTLCDPMDCSQPGSSAGRFFTVWDTRKAQHSPKFPCVILMALQCLSLMALLQCSPFKTLIFK